jgi:hypothetical protein
MSEITNAEHGVEMPTRLGAEDRRITQVTGHPSEESLVGKLDPDTKWHDGVALGGTQHR